MTLRINHDSRKLDELEWDFMYVSIVCVHLCVCASDSICTDRLSHVFASSIICEREADFCILKKVLVLHAHT